MADGPYRFPIGQHFYHHSYDQHRHPRRPLTPLSLRSRLTDTPTPSQSPGPQSPRTANMYAQNHGSSQHLMNGGNHQRYNNAPISLVKPFQHQAHSHGQHHLSQHDPNNHNHSGNYAHHQHSHSGSAMSAAGGHYGSGHLGNGAPSGQYSSPGKPPNEHYAAQLTISTQIRGATEPNYYARHATGLIKNVIAGNSNTDSVTEERQRPSAEDTATKREGDDWTVLDLSGQCLRNLSPVIFDYGSLTKLYLANNKISYLPPEIGKLRSLKILDLSLNNLHELPTQIGMLVNMKELLLVDNQLINFPYELGNLYQCQMIAIEGNPLNDEFRQLVIEHGSAELIKTLLENAPDPAPPNERDWIVLDDSPIPDDDKFSLLDYNTLCHHYCTSALYGYTPSTALSWEHRREVIMSEIRARDADIVCLQEVEHDAYETYFRANLAHDDYKGAFWPKGRARTMGPEGAKLVDGCATFWKNSKYILLDKQLIDIPTAAINRPDMKGESDIYNRVMPKDNVAIITFLENRKTGARLIVVNAHLHWDHHFKDVKVIQVAVLLEQIGKHAQTYTSWPPLNPKEKMVYRYANGDKPDGEEQEEQEPPQPSKTYTDPLSIPLILCGDFNSLPVSGPYELLANGTIPPNHEDLAGRSYGNFTKTGISHHFNLKSAYSQIGELPFTNYVSNFNGVVDYIWYATNNLSVRGLLGEVDPEYLARVPGFPNVHFPSDHLALFTEFAFKTRRPPGPGTNEPSGS